MGGSGYTDQAAIDAAIEGANNDLNTERERNLQLRDALIDVQKQLVDVSSRRDEAVGLLWRLRRYEAMDDSASTEEVGVELSKAFDDWYARNPDPTLPPT